MSGEPQAGTAGAVDVSLPAVFWASQGMCTVSRDGVELRPRKQLTLRLSRTSRTRFILYAAGASVAVAVIALGYLGSLGSACICSASFFFALVCMLAVWDWVGQPATEVQRIARHEIASVVAHPPNPRIHRGSFELHRVGVGLTTVHIEVRGGDQPGSDYRRAEAAFHAIGVLGIRCSACQYLLLLEQERCPECGAARSSRPR